jgi:hypothetical protein
MATRLPDGRWKSSNGNIFTSELAAAKEDREARVSVRQNSRGAQILDSLSGDDLQEVVKEMNHRVDLNAGREDMESEWQDFIATNPTFINEGTLGVQNSAALKGYLRGQGFMPPYTSGQIQAGFDALAPTGALFLTEKHEGPSIDDLYDMPLEELKERANRQAAGLKNEPYHPKKKVINL